jgi:hypothetical protein
MRKVLSLAAALCLAAVPAWAAAGRIVRLKPGYAMCRTEGALHRLVAASRADDGHAFAGLVAGPCRVTRGERIRVASRRAQVVRFVVRGRRGNWWTVVEALR